MTLPTRADKELQQAERELQEAALRLATLKFRRKDLHDLGLVLLSKEDAKKIQSLLHRFFYRNGWFRVAIRRADMNDYRGMNFIGLEDDEEDPVTKLLLET